MATRRKKITHRASENLENRFGPLTLGGLLRATLLGIPQQHLSDIENERKAVSPERAYRWAKKLGYIELERAELALQDALDKARLGVRVHLERAPSTKHRGRVTFTSRE